MATRRLRHVLAVSAAVLPGVLFAQEGPLSAIDWLSDSIDETVVAAPPSDAPPASLPTDVAVLPLGAPVPDSAGLVDAADLGLDPGLWGRSSAADLAAALARVPDNPDAPASLRRFVTDLMQARLDPPIDAGVDQGFFLARLDRLLASGHLDAAKAMIAEAGVTEPQRFRRYFDIDILKGAETEACRLIEETPDLSPTYPARIFCLARLGQWDVAALTLGNAESLGILTEDEEQLLLHFLDPELLEGEPVPAAPRRPTPLVFRLYEAVGERIQTDQLPVAFAAADLSETVGWRTRLRAAERLAETGAMSVDGLLEVYAEREPAASGGIFDRVQAVEAMLRALERRDAQALDRTLSPGWSAAKDGGFAAPFAAWLAPRLAGIDLAGPAAHVGFEIALLANDGPLARRLANDKAEDRFLVALAVGERSAVPPSDPLGQAVLRGLSALRPGPAQQPLIEDDRRGEALFRALEQLSDGAAGNPDATAQSLAVLKALGLEPLARRIAVELILAEGAA